MYLDLQSFYFQRFQSYLKGFQATRFSDSAVQNNTQNAQDFFESLVNIVGPAR